MFRLCHFIAAAVVGPGITTSHVVFASGHDGGTPATALRATADDGNPGPGFESDYAEVNGVGRRVNRATLRKLRSKAFFHAAPSNVSNEPNGDPPALFIRISSERKGATVSSIAVWT
jgi:hypothetical protein